MNLLAYSPTRLLAYSLFAFLASFSSAQQPGGKLPADATLSSLRLEFEIFQAEALKPVKELDNLYSTNLAKLQAAAQQAGRLEEVLAVKAELEKFAQGSSPEVPETFSEVRRFQTIYRQERGKRLAAAQQAQNPARQNFLRNLEWLKTRLTQQGKFDDAVAVSEAIKALASQTGAVIPLGLPAAPASMPIGAGAASTFAGGKLFGVGKIGDLPGVVIDLSAAEGIGDFVDVTGNSRSWAALRKDGTAIGWHSKNGAYTMPGIRKLIGDLMFNADHIGITTSGKLVNLANGQAVIDAENVVDAVKEQPHGLALLEDGTVKVWGNIYEVGVGQYQPFPKPPQSALQDVAMIGASRYHAWIVTQKGDVVGWGTKGIHNSISRDFRGVTGIWGYSWGFFAETKRSDFLSYSVFNPTSSKPVEGNPEVIRSGEEAVIQLLKNRWQILHLSVPSLHDERASLEKLDGNDLPFFYLKEANGKAVVSYLLWLSADEPE